MPTAFRPHPGAARTSYAAAISPHAPARAYDAYVEELDKAGWRAPRLPAGTREKLLGAPDVLAAGGRLGAYQQQVCGTTG